MGGTDYFRLAGQVLDGRYRVDQVVGEGGFGVVYRGFHLAFAHPIAVKCLKTPPHFTEEGQAIFLAKFREEAQLLSRLSQQHLSIVRVYDFNTVETPRGISAPYMVLEWLDGEPLDAWLEARRGRPVPEAEAVALLRTAIEALAHAHAQNVAHRDVKPANIFVLGGAQGRSTKVLDFGIAKAMQEGETATQLRTHTTSGFSAFSPPYGAPEQFRTKKFGPTGPWTDVHALGLILTEMVTGRPALEGEELADFMVASTDAVRPTPNTRGGSVSSAFDAVCARAVACAAADRYRDAGELLRALDGAIAAEPVATARRVPTDPRDPTVLPVPTSPLAQVPPSTAWQTPGSVLLGASLPAPAVHLRATQQASPEELANAAAGPPVGAPMHPVPAPSPWQQPAGATSRPVSSSAPGARGVVPGRRGLVVAASIGAAVFVTGVGALIVSRPHPGDVGAAPPSTQTAPSASACAGGDQRACVTVGTWFEDASNPAKDENQAAHLYQQACKAKVLEGCEALVKLGTRYEEGTDVAKDDNRAAALFGQECEATQDTGCKKLMTMAEVYQSKEDAAHATELRQRACDAGYANACEDLAMFDYTATGWGRGDGSFVKNTNRDPARRFAAAKRACELGHAGGCVSLGLCYAEGEGVAKDSAKAATLYRQGCDGGYTLGCEWAAEAYETGRGVPKDHARAVSLYRLGCKAEQNLRGQSAAKDSASCAALKGLGETP